MKTKIIVVLTLVTAFSLFAEAPKNIILFIGDGMSTPQRMTAEEFSRKTGRGPLALNNLPFQATTRTCSASSLVTDSAAAATAIACGEKTSNGALGVDAQGKRLTSSAEVAKRAGKKVGIVTTVTINHATPSGFYAHRKSRGDSYGIGVDLLESNFDYFAGDRLSGHGDKKHKEYKGDIYELAKKQGYTFIKNDLKAFKALKPGADKVWFVANDYPFSIDFESANEKEAKYPTLAEMTAKGLELLKGSPKGFFMMVEGGKVDYAGHANDAAANLRDLLALDDAVKVALDFQKQNPDTLVVVTGDHETGGMTMGFQATGYNFYMDKLAGQRISVDRFTNLVKAEKRVDFKTVKAMVEKNFKFDFNKDDWNTLEQDFLSDVDAEKHGRKENEAYDAKKLSKFPATLKAIISHKCGIGWSSGAHTALPVLTTASGPGAEAFHGFIDNTDIAKTLKSYIK